MFRTMLEILLRTPVMHAILCSCSWLRNKTIIRKLMIHEICPYLFKLMSTYKIEMLFIFIL